MPHDHVPSEWLAEYSKGVLLEPRLAQVEEHLLVCEFCRQQLNQFDDQLGIERVSCARPFLHQAATRVSCARLKSRPRCRSRLTVPAPYNANQIRNRSSITGATSVNSAGNLPIKLSRSAVINATTIVEDSSAANKRVPRPSTKQIPPIISRDEMKIAFAAGKGIPRLPKNEMVRSRFCSFPWPV